MGLSTQKEICEIYPDITIRHDLRSGDLGTMINMHGRIYASECGYNMKFEAYVCRTFYDLGMQYDPDADMFWLAEAGDHMVGSIAVIAKEDNIAQLRWFLVEPEYRKHHLGRYLFNKALDYCLEKGYNQIFLYTTLEQKTALSIYEKAGFILDHEEESQSNWGHPIQERKYILDFRRQP